MAECSRRGTLRSVSEIKELLKELDARPADELEGQDLDFKEWDLRSRKTAVGTVCGK